MKHTMIGADLAKRVFQLHGATIAGEVKFRKKRTLDQFRAFMAAQPAALIVFEACESASYWLQRIEAFGHEVQRISRRRRWCSGNVSGSCISTELVNALRAVLYEYGHVFPVGFCHVKRPPWGQRQAGGHGEKRAKVGDALRGGISKRCRVAVNSLLRKGYATFQRLPSPNCLIHQDLAPTRSLTSSAMERAS